VSRSTIAGYHEGPFFDELERGQELQAAPSLTLTAGHAAAHQAIVGDRLRLALDEDLSMAVTGEPGILAHPALVWDVAIGQSTLVTRRVIANLFYGGLTFRRAPIIGDTLHTTTEIVALRQNRVRPGRAATGMAVLRVHTVDQKGRDILDFVRCAMLPLADPDGQTGADDDLDKYKRDADDSVLAAVSAWDLDAFRDREVRGGTVALHAGQIWSSAGGDVVSSAPELARLTLNVAKTHHDETSDGRRLVYGGHTIGLAMAQLTRILPCLITVVAWRGCDHLAPVMEGDTLTSEVDVERCRPLPDGGVLVDLRSRVSAQAGREGELRAVLDWRLVGLVP
jgi:acyl dehydratase